MKNTYFVLTKVQYDEDDFYNQSQDTIVPLLFAGLDTLKSYVENELPEYSLEEKKEAIYISYNPGGKLEQLEKQEKELSTEIYGLEGASVERYKTLSKEEQTERLNLYYDVEQALEEIRDFPVRYKVTELALYEKN